jgi:hypothetical protein
MQDYPGRVDDLPQTGRGLRQVRHRRIGNGRAGDLTGPRPLLSTPDDRLHQIGPQPLDGGHKPGIAEHRVSPDNVAPRVLDGPRVSRGAARLWARSQHLRSVLVIHWWPPRECGTGCGRSALVFHSIMRRSLRQSVSDSRRPAYQHPDGRPASPKGRLGCGTNHGHAFLACRSDHRRRAEASLPRLHLGGPGLWDARTRRQPFIMRFAAPGDHGRLGPHGAARALPDRTAPCSQPSPGTCWVRCAATAWSPPAPFQQQCGPVMNPASSRGSSSGTRPAMEFQNLDS